MNVESLVRMANQIAQFFESQADARGAPAGVAEHLTKFWDPRMRAAIIEHWQTSGEGLGETASRAVALLSAPRPLSSQAAGTGALTPR